MNLVVKNLNKQFRQGDSHVLVLKHLSAIFEGGQSAAIMGVSGAGKSTFMHILAGLDQPTSGTIEYCGQDIGTLSSPEREQFLNKSIGLMFQSPYLIKELSVLENVMVPGIIAGGDYARCAVRAKELVCAVGLEHKEGAPVSSLSGGQQQRVALARALLNNPQFLLADEPTGNLDIKTGSAMIELLLSLQKKYHMGIIISTHDQYVADRMQILYELRNGTLHKV